MDSLILTAFQADALKALAMSGEHQLNVIGHDENVVVYIDDVWAPLSGVEAALLVMAEVVKSVQAIAPYDFSYTLSDSGRKLVDAL